MTKIVIPTELQRPTWLVSVGRLPYTLNLPAGKGVGTSVAMDTDNATLVPAKWSHIQLPIADQLGIPWSNRWFNVQAYKSGGVPADHTWLISNAYLHPNAIIASEMSENWYNHAMPNRVEEVYQGWYNRMKSEFGVTSPNQTRLYSDYWLFQLASQADANWIFNMNESFLRQGLSNQEYARKEQTTDWQWGGQAGYFNGPVNYRNILLGGYISNHWGWREGIPVYNWIYNYEKWNLAFTEYRRMLKFGWVGMEGIQSRPIWNGGSNCHIRFPGGRIIRHSKPNISYKGVWQMTFWHLLLADDIVFWNVAFRFNEDPTKFAVPAEGPSHNSGSYGNIRWQPDGGAIVTYNPSDPTHPQRNAGPGTFAFQPQDSENAAFAGAWLYSQISGVSDRVSYGMRYTPFRYKIGSGTWQTGYHDGNDPVFGSLGNARVSHHGTKNYGQDNVVRSFFAGKPLCMRGTGVAGACIVFYIAKAPLNETITIECYGSGSTKTYTCVGSGTHVFYE